MAHGADDAERNARDTQQNKQNFHRLSFSALRLCAMDALPGQIGFCDRRLQQRFGRFVAEPSAQHDKVRRHARLNAALARLLAFRIGARGGK